jgi:predicted GH43/DUF377 family glycosyl hydrolase
MRYIRKPVVLDAFLFGSNTTPDWFIDEQQLGRISTTFYDEKVGKKAVNILVKEGLITAYDGMYIVRNEHNEIYPVKKAIFEMVYEEYRGKSNRKRGNNYD